MIKDLLEVKVQLESVALEDPEGPSGKIGEMGPVGSRGEIGVCGEKGDNGDTGGVGQQGPIGPQGSTGRRGVQGAKGLHGVVVSKVLLECKDLLVLLVGKVNVAQKETKVFKVLLELEVIVVNTVSMV